VVASNAGENVDPAWYRNLVADPNAEVEVPGGRRSVRARTATAAEAERLWPSLDTAYREYARYRRRTTRTIPVVILEPRKPPADPGP
jgi:deazaflavin-dependent oxidoreductase (nitroreductase family)